MTRRAISDCHSCRKAAWTLHKLECGVKGGGGGKELEEKKEEEEAEEE
jgi:hypothetical protein